MRFPFTQKGHGATAASLNHLISSRWHGSILLAVTSGSSVRPGLAARASSTILLTVRGHSDIVLHPIFATKYRPDVQGHTRSYSCCMQVGHV